MTRAGAAALVALVALALVGRAIRDRTVDRPPVLPTPATPAPSHPNGYAQLADAARSAAVPPSFFAITPPCPTALTAADRRALAADSGAFALLEEGLAYPVMPVGRPVDFAPLHRALLAAVDLSLEEGDRTRALRLALDDVAMNEALASRSDNYAAALLGAHQGRERVSFAARSASGADLAAAARRLEAIDARHVSAVAILAAEKDDDMQRLATNMTYPDWRLRLFPRGERAAVLGRFGWTSKQEIIDRAAAVDDELIAEARHPYRKPVRRKRRWDDVGIVEEGADAVRLADATDSAENRALLVRLASQAYRDAVGRYPSRIAALCPRYLNAIPVDPFAEGRPFGLDGHGGVTSAEPRS